MNRLDLHPFARRLIKTGEELSRSGMAAGNNCQLTAFDAQEQLLWATAENAFFSELTGHHLSVFRIDVATQKASPFITHSENPPHKHWEADYQLLLHSEDATVALRCLTPYALIWGQWAQKKNLVASGENLLPGFNPRFVADLNDSLSVVTEFKKAEKEGAAIQVIFSKKEEAPLIFGNSLEEIITRQYQLETACKSRIILEQLLH